VVVRLKNLRKTFPMIAYVTPLPPQGVKDESGLKILKDIKAQIKNLGKYSPMKHRATRSPSHLNSSLKVCACFRYLLLM